MGSVANEDAWRETTEDLWIMHLYEGEGMTSDFTEISQGWDFAKLKFVRSFPSNGRGSYKVSEIGSCHIEFVHHQKGHYILRQYFMTYAR